MPRIARMIIPDEKAVYHVMSRTALDGFPFGDIEKDHMVQLIQKFSRLYFVEILGYCVMGNHFHLLARIFPGNDFSNEDIKQCYINFYGKDRDFSEEQIPCFREKWSSLSEFVKEIKQRPFFIIKYITAGVPYEEIGSKVLLLKTGNLDQLAWLTSI